MNAYLRRRIRHGSLFPDSFIEGSTRRVTQAEIDSLGIELRVNGKLQARVHAGQKKARGILKEIVKLNK